MIAPTLDQIKKAIYDKGYKWLCDVNIGGIRTKDNSVDKWNDWLYVEYKGKFHIAQGTTRPGLYWLNHPERESGVFVMCPGQHLNIWKKGFHHDYPALVQCAPIPGWRDNNLNNIVDPDQSKIYTDGQGVNFHHAHPVVKQVIIDKYSAGCQVTDDIKDWNIFFELYGESSQQYFSYTLLLDEDFK